MQNIVFVFERWWLYECWWYYLRKTIVKNLYVTSIM